MALNPGNSAFESVEAAPARDASAKAASAWACDAGIVESFWDRSGLHYQKFRSFVEQAGRLYGKGAVEEISDKVRKVVSGHDVRWDDIRREVAAILEKM